MSTEEREDLLISRIDGRLGNVEIQKAKEVCDCWDDPAQHCCK